MPQTQVKTMKIRAGVFYFGGYKAEPKSCWTQDPVNGFGTVKLNRDSFPKIENVVLYSHLGLSKPVWPSFFHDLGLLEL